jgi:hypothetical protein
VPLSSIFFSNLRSCRIEVTKRYLFETEANDNFLVFPLFQNSTAFSLSSNEINLFGLFNGLEGRLPLCEDSPIEFSRKFYIAPECY